MDFYEERVETALLRLCDRKKSQGLFIFSVKGRNHHGSECPAGEWVSGQAYKAY